MIPHYIFFVFQIRFLSKVKFGPVMWCAFVGKEHLRAQPISCYMKINIKNGNKGLKHGTVI